MFHTAINRFACLVRSFSSTALHKPQLHSYVPLPPPLMKKMFNREVITLAFGAANIRAPVGPGIAGGGLRPGLLPNSNSVCSGPPRQHRTQLPAVSELVGASEETGGVFDPLGLATDEVGGGLIRLGGFGFRFGGCSSWVFQQRTRLRTCSYDWSAGQRVSATYPTLPDRVVYLQLQVQAIGACTAVPPFIVRRCITLFTVYPRCLRLLLYSSTSVVMLGVVSARALFCPCASE